MHVTSRHLPKLCVELVLFEIDDKLLRLSTLKYPSVLRRRVFFRVDLVGRDVGRCTFTNYVLVKRCASSLSVKGLRCVFSVSCIATELIISSARNYH